MKKLLLVCSLGIACVSQAQTHQSHLGVSAGGTLTRIDNTADSIGQHYTLSLSRDFYGMLRFTPSVSFSNYNSLLKAGTFAGFDAGLILKANQLELVPNAGVSIGSLTLSDHSNVRMYLGQGGLDIKIPLSYYSSIGVSYKKQQSLIPDVLFDSDVVSLCITIKL